MSLLYKQNKINKVDISLKQLSDLDTTNSLYNNRLDNIRDNQILVSATNKNRQDVFRFKYLTDLIQAGSGVTITDSNGVLTISSTGGGGGSSPLTAKGDLYTRNASADTRLPVGLNTQVLIADSSTTTGLRWGTNTAPTPTGYYGSFFDITTQVATLPNTAYPMFFGQTDLSNGVTIVSNGTNLTRITIANTGIYNIQFSAQLSSLDVAPHDATIWLRKNGVDIPDSAGYVGMESRKSPLDPYHLVAAWNYVVSAVGGDYFEIMWAVDDVDVTIIAYPATVFAPEVPSTILTVTQQSGIMAGTGITAINSLTGAVQTMVTGTAGTDFGISSAGTAHTFNLPLASATNTGKLSSTDWSTFNGKQNNIGLTTVGTNLATLPNPSAVSYLRINADNTVTALTLAQLKSDLGLNRTVLGSDVSTTAVSTALVDVTGLTFPIVSGNTYKFTARLVHTASVANIGLKWAVNADVAVSNITYRTLQNAGVVTAFFIHHANALNSASTNSGATQSNQINTIEGILVANNTGTAIIRFGKSQANAGTLTVKAGSFVEYEII